MPGFLTTVSAEASRIGSYADDAARDAAIPYPYTGLQIYNIAAGTVQFWNGTAWIGVVQIANLDGGAPDSIYGGTPDIDAGGVI